jgi:hypothetical protein
MSETLQISTDRGEQGRNARQHSHVARQQWEARWLAEQRTGSHVVDYARQQSQTPEAMQHEHGKEPQLPPERAVVQSGSKKLWSPPQTLRIELQQRALSQPLLQRSARANSGVVIDRQFVPIENKVGVDQAVSTAVSEAGRGRSRDPLQRMAFWRESDSVALSMRLPTAQPSHPIIQQVREWLREAGVRLSRVIVNGRTEYETVQIEPAVKDAANSPALHKHI